MKISPPPAEAFEDLTLQFLPILLAEALLAMEPGQEAAERELMQLLGQAGRRGEVLRRYRRLARWLRAELGVDPAPETKRLVRLLLS